MTESEQDDSTSDSGDMQRAMKGLEIMDDMMGMEHVPRHVVKLFQCPECSKILDAPTTLPCGISICRSCVPERFQRNVSFPEELASAPGFLCRFCEEEHTEGKIDVTLCKIVSSVMGYLSSLHPFDDRTAVALQKDSIPETSPVILHGGRLAATFTLAENGGLPYGSDLVYNPVSASDAETTKSDKLVLRGIKDVLQSEVECAICSGILFDPVTTTCGHTFCRQCLERVLDNTSLCPNCRHELYLPSILPGSSTNRFIGEILINLFGSELQERAQAKEIEERPGDDAHSLDTPIFVCTPSLPHTPTFLHIFEPRYRLMLRRVLEGNRRFGMCYYNPTRHPQGDLHYGTLLQVINARWEPDGRAMIETRGISKFRIKRHGIKDEYIVADIERHDDLHITEEQNLEAFDMRLAPDSWNGMSTQELLRFGHDLSMRFISENPQLRIPNVYGYPPMNARILPYYIGAVLPLQEPERYKLIPERSVRQRLKIALYWLVNLHTLSPRNG